MAIDYTKIDQGEVREELISLLRQTETFKDANFTGSALYDLANNMSYVASLYGFYLNQIANEPFINSAKQYKNINRIANSLLYNPVGKGSAQVNVASSLSKEYVLQNAEGFIEIPPYSLFPSNKKTTDGEDFSFTNKHALSVQVKQFGVSNIKETDIKYTGTVFGGGLDPTKLELVAFVKKPVHYVTGRAEIVTIEKNMVSVADSSLSDFVVDTIYSMFVKKIGEDYTMIVADKTTDIRDDEVARFRINTQREVIFDQAFTANKFMKGRLGFRNLEYVNIRAISYPGIANSVARVEMVIPKFSPAFQVLYHGDIFSFSSEVRDIVISSDRLDGSFFSDSKIVSIVLEINDPDSEDHGAKIYLKKPEELQSNDVVIATINPETSSRDDRGNLLVEENQFIKGETKTGVLSFDATETTKRVVFEAPYDFGIVNEELNANSAKNYSVHLYVNDNIVTFYSDKTVNGFIISVEDGTDFSGEVYWKTVAYENSVVQSKKVEASGFLENVSGDDYAVILQPDNNANVWVSSSSEADFTVESDTAFVGFVDFMIVPSKDFSTTPEPKELGQIYVPKGETEIEVKLNTVRSDSNYQVFLQPNGNVKTWFSRKATDGFVINIEPETDFFGVVDWQIYSSTTTGTTFFEGGSGFSNEPQLNFQDLPETANLGLLDQGIAKMSKISNTGIIDTQINSLQLEYGTEETIKAGFSFVVANTDISYNNIRVFVGGDDTYWKEYTRADEYKRVINKDSAVFYVRVNKDKKINIFFGDNNFRGKSPYGEDIFIIGMECVGAEGNIASGVLSDAAIGSFNFLVSDIVTSEVSSSLVDLLRIKQDVFFEGQTPVISDYRGDAISNDALKIVQLDNAFNGSDVEEADSIRKNAQFSYRSQNRLVTKEDYENAIAANFLGVVETVQVFNYREIDDTGLFDLGDNPERYFNTLFFLIVPSFGKGLTFLQRDNISQFLSGTSNKVIGVDSIILEPRFVEIDVSILYTVSQNASAITARNDVLNGVYEYFERSNRRLGETITISNISSAISKDNVSGLEIQLKRDDESNLSAADYDVDITPDEYQDVFQETENRQLDDAIKRELRNLIGKGIIELKQPLFDVQRPNGDREWLFVNHIKLGKYEFPVLGDVVIERKV